MDPCRYSAWYASAQVRSGELTAEACVESCLEPIDARDRDVHAWAAIDAGFARRQAVLRDRSNPLGPLHGIPAGFKDRADWVHRSLA